MKKPTRKDYAALGRAFSARQAKAGHGNVGKHKSPLHAAKLRLAARKASQAAAEARAQRRDAK